MVAVSGTRIALAVTLLAGTVAAVGWPQRTIAPGPLHPGHGRLASDCLACHVPLSGPSAAKCLSCHPLHAIGRQTSTGQPLPRPRPRSSLVHRAMVAAGEACDACHLEHQRSQGRVLTFKHDLFPDPVRANCSACHDADRPTNALHRHVGTTCDACHGTVGWKPARFSHDALPAAQRATCIECHASKRPTDTLHVSSGEACASCHGTQAWTPATFAHERYFRFDGDHPSTCVTCHPTAGTFKSYTCYGCHEHTPAKMQAEHRRQQGQNLDQCARCHRSSDEHGAEGGERGDQREKGDSKRGERQRPQSEHGEHDEDDHR